MNTTLHHCTATYSVYKREGKTIANALWSERRGAWLISGHNDEYEPHVWATSREAGLLWVEEHV